MDEEFKKLPDFPDYSISNLGRVRRDVATRNCKAGTFIKRTVIRLGYRAVTIYNSKGKRVWIQVHQLVCRAFNGECPGIEYEVAHYDGDPTNNCASNLRWATPKENAADRTRHGRTLFGTQCHQTKLNEEQVIEIRRLRAQGMLLKDIAAKFPIAWGSINDITMRRTWKHVVGP